MKISSFDTGIYRVPLTENWGSSNYAFSSLEFVVVWLKTDTGHVGTGWTFSVGNGGSAFKSLIDHYLARKVLGEDPMLVERLWNKMWLESHDIGSAGVSTHAIAAIDIAIWDLIGQAVGQPLYRLLGGYKEAISGYGSGVNLHLSIDDLLTQMESFMSQGYRTIKMKIGCDDVYEDLERLMAVRKFVGRKVGIAIDANKKWHPGEVVRRIDILKAADLYWLEEPTISDDIPGHTLIREKCNIPVVPHFGMELVAHVGCALPNVLMFEGLRGADLSEMGVMVEPIKVLNGKIKPSLRPGHGIQFDMDKLKSYEMSEDALRQQRVSTRTDV